jgi:ribosome maturation factor RimP
MTKAVSTLLVLLLMFPPGALADAGEPPIPVVAQTGTGPTQSAWDRVADLPAGSRLKLLFTNGTEVTGTVVEVNSDSVVLRDNEAGPSGLRTKEAVSLREGITFARSDVAEAMVVAMARRYVAPGQTDPVAVRHVVTALGAGQRVDVNTANQRRRARIESIDEDSFTIARGSESERIAYRDVREIKAATMRGHTKALIITGAVVGAMMLITLAKLAYGNY